MGGLSQQVDFAMGGSPQRMDIAGGVIATGQIAQTCVFSAAARAATSRATDRTKRPPALPDRVGRQPVCRGVCCGLDGAAPWALFHQTERRLWVLRQQEKGAVGLARLRRVECRFRRRQRSWLQGLFNAEILYGALGFWACLEAHWAFRFAFPQSARREFRVGLARREFCVCLVRRDFRVGLARREVKNFMLWAEPPARQTESVQT